MSDLEAARRALRPLWMLTSGTLVGALFAAQLSWRGWLLALLLLIAVAAIAIFLLKGGPTERADEPAESPQSDEEAVLETPPVVAGTLLASSDSQQSQPEPSAAAEPAPAAAKPEPEVTMAVAPEQQLPAVTSTPAAGEPAPSATILPGVLDVGLQLEFNQE